MDSNVMNKMEKVLLSKEAIDNKITELAKTIEKDYQGKKILMVCILRGAFLFFSDIVRKINLPIEIDFMAISSYGTNATSSGEVKVIKDLNERLEGKDVIIVEDIIDSGYTLNYLKNLFQQRNPNSLKVCALLDKPDRRKINIEGDYVGFKIPNEFVVGYGLDYAEQFRNLDSIYILKPEVYTK